MDTAYWIMEYGKVFFGYLFLMFLWPSVVFGRHLKEKNRTYRFSFCVTVQIVIVNTVVLMLGLFHILNRLTVILFFYGIFFYAVVKKLWLHRGKIRLPHIPRFRYRFRDIRLRVREKIWECKQKIRPYLQGYGVLAVVLLFGMIYFSYGAFQVHCYGWGDLYVHHAWIDGLSKGTIFADGVYPEAMHCFIYSMNVLFGTEVYSILLFLQGIHVIVFLLSAFLLFREVFHWKYSPVFVIMLFLTLDVVSADHVYSMFRLQITLPLEFGLHTQFLCALYLVRYLRNSLPFHWKGRNTKYYWDENLFLFIMSFTASIAIHFYATIMAFIMCLSFASFALKKICSRKHLIPLAGGIMCGCVIAVLPMAGALASGTPFNYSIQWAIEAMDGEESRQLENEGQDSEETDQPQEIQYKGIDIGGLPKLLERGSRFFKKILPGTYRKGYVALYGEGRSKWILGFTGIAIALCVIGRFRPYKRLHQISQGYPPVILFTFFFIVTYAMPYLGYPELISDSRFCSVGHLMILAVTVMPVDVFFSWLTCFWSESVLRAISAFSTAGIYVFTILLGNYHGFLFYELSRYNSTVKVTNSIIENFPQYSYTIVAPTDELYPVSQYGWHEELQAFVQKSAGADYSLPSEYVFIYVEKKPLLYAQAHFFEGPSWLGEEKYCDIYWEKYSQKFPYSGASQAPEIKSSEVSETAAQSEMPKIYNAWFPYTRLENRTILESKAYKWCGRFAKLYPHAMKVYYEDDDFVCYYFRQEAGVLYNLGIE